MSTLRKPRILRVWIEHKPDSDPDTSHMGEYSDRPTSTFSLDRQELGHAGRNEYRYFNPSFNYVDEAGWRKEGLTAKEVREYVQQDYARMEALDRGDWQYIGVIAKAEVQLTSDLVQVLRSGGLWGVESDSDASHLQTIADEELASLRHELIAVGLGKRAIDRAFANVTTRFP